MKEITAGSLFDGIGGFPLSAATNGIKTIWASEIEPFPIAVTRERFPGMMHLGSITEIDGAKIPPVDIVTGGEPVPGPFSGGKARRAGGRTFGAFYGANQSN